MIQDILNLPVIVQGALGSLLFWLVFAAAKISTDFASHVIGKLNKSWREEAYEFEHLQSQYMIAEPLSKANYILLAIYGAANRTLQGLIHLCIGAVVNGLAAPFGLIGYCFAVVHFFRALKAIPFTVRDGKTIDWHRLRVDGLQRQLDELTM